MENLNLKLHLFYKLLYRNEKLQNCSAKSNYDQIFRICVPFLMSFHHFQLLSTIIIIRYKSAVVPFSDYDTILY